MKKNGFTLIELLVVISIICLLIGILLSAISAAKDAADNAHKANDAPYVEKIVRNVYVFKKYHNFDDRDVEIWKSNLANLLKDNPHLKVTSITQEDKDYIIVFDGTLESDR